MDIVDNEIMSDGCHVDIDKISHDMAISVNIEVNDNMAIDAADISEGAAINDIIALINSLDNSCIISSQIDTSADKLHKSISDIYNIWASIHKDQCTNLSVSAMPTVRESDNSDTPRVFLYNRLVYAINNYYCDNSNAHFDRLPEQTCSAVIKYLIIMLYGDLVRDFVSSVNDDLRQIFHKYFLIYIRNGWNVYDMCNIVNTVYISHKSLSIQVLCDYFANKYNLNQNIPYIDLLQIIKFHDVITYFDSLYISNLNKVYNGGGGGSGSNVCYTMPTLPLASSFYKGAALVAPINKNMEIDIIIAAGSKCKYYLQALNISSIKLTTDVITKLIVEFNGFSALGDIELDINIKYLIGDLQYLIATCHSNYSRELVLKYIDALKGKRASLLDAVMSKFDFGYVNSMFYADNTIIVAAIYNEQYSLHNTIKLYLLLVYENYSVNLNLGDAIWLLFTSNMARYIDYPKLLKEYSNILINADYRDVGEMDWNKYHTIITMLYDIYTSQFNNKISDKNGQVNIYKFYANIGMPALSTKDIDISVYKRSINFRKSYYSLMSYVDYKKVYNYLSTLTDKVILSTENVDSNVIINAISTFNPTILQEELQTYSSRIFNTNLHYINNAAATTPDMRKYALNNYVKTVADVITYISIVDVGADILQVLERDYFVSVRQNINNQPEIRQLMSDAVRVLIQNGPATYEVISNVLGGCLNAILFDGSMAGHKRQILINKICTKIIFNPVVGVSIARQLQYYNTVTISLNDIYYALYNAANDVIISEVAARFAHIIEYIILLVDSGQFSVNSSKQMEYTRSDSDQVGRDSSVVSSTLELVVFKYKYNIIDLFDKLSRESASMSLITYRWRMGTFIIAAKIVADLNCFDRLVQVLCKYKMVAIDELNRPVLRNLIARVYALIPEHKIIFIILHCLWGGGEYLENVYNFLHFVISQCSRHESINDMIGGPRLCKYLMKLAADDANGLNTDITRLLYTGLDRGDIGIVTYLMNNMLTRTIIYTHIGYIIRDISYWAKSRQSIELFICILGSLNLLSTDCIYLFMVNNIINYEVVKISIAEIEVLIGAHLLVSGKVNKLNNAHFGYICPHCCLFVENVHNYSAGLVAPYGIHECRELNIFLPHFIKRITKANNVKNKIYITYNVYIDSVGIAINNVPLRSEVDNVANIMSIIFDMCKNYILFLKMYMKSIIEYTGPAITYISEVTKYARTVTADNKYCVKLLNLGTDSGGPNNRVTHICITCAKARGLSELVISNELGGVACKSCKTNLFMNSVYFNCVDAEFK